MPIFGFPGVPRWADFVSFCSIDCTPVWTGLEEVTASPFHVVLQGPLSGPIDLYAGGALYVTTAPIFRTGFGGPVGARSRGTGPPPSPGGLACDAPHHRRK